MNVKKGVKGVVFLRSTSAAARRKNSSPPQHSSPHARRLHHSATKQSPSAKAHHLGLM